MHLEDVKYERNTHSEIIRMHIKFPKIWLFNLNMYR